MVSRTWIRREREKTKFTERYRGQEIVERQDRPKSERTGHIKKTHKEEEERQQQLEREQQGKRGIDCLARCNLGRKETSGGRVLITYKCNNEQAWPRVQPPAISPINRILTNCPGQF